MDHALGSISLRPLTADDLPLVRRAFDCLSAESRYLRYGFSTISPEVALGWMARLGQTGPLAIGACERDGTVVGVARLEPTAAGTAEIAVTVADRWQGRGLGRLLLTALLRHAAAAGLREVEAFVLPANRRALRLLTSVGGHRVAAGALWEYHAPTSRCPA